MTAVELACEAAKLAFVVRKVDGFELLPINPRPDRMRVPPPVLLMEDNRARLASETKTVLGLSNGLFKIFNRNFRILRRVKRQREQIFIAACGIRDRLSFGKRAVKIVCNKPINAMHRDMIIVARVQQMPREF
ncbi:hypothetical protein [uncultured Roseobacter sp.]|uniref:hypothetical protein n=1 Tax=uncultured Roseobacter sp. TaxID=114847 RepID=UPI0026348C46|nr:hypothetical protein [uncultured Roseobacter sp.]